MRVDVSADGTAALLRNAHFSERSDRFICLEEYTASVSPSCPVKGCLSKRNCVVQLSPSTKTMLLPFPLRFFFFQVRQNQKEE